jgi:hypothetical protein
MWTLRLPILIEGIHRPVVDMGWLQGRFAIQEPIGRVTEELRRFQALGCSHIALDLAYTTFPAILETIDILARDVRPQVAE